MVIANKLVEKSPFFFFFFKENSRIIVLRLLIFLTHLVIRRCSWTKTETLLLPEQSEMVSEAECAVHSE